MSNNLPSPQWKYIGATPGADTTERALFDTTVAFTTVGELALAGVKRLIVQQNVSGAVNLKIYFSLDRGANWVEDADQAQLNVVGVDQIDFKIEPYAGSDLKITSTNVAASTQTTYTVKIVGSYDRAPAV